MVIASDCLESILGQREKAIFKYGYEYVYCQDPMRESEKNNNKCRKPLHSGSTIFCPMSQSFPPVQSRRRHPGIS